MVWALEDGTGLLVVVFVVDIAKDITNYLHQMRWFRPWQLFRLWQRLSRSEKLSNSESCQGRKTLSDSEKVVRLGKSCQTRKIGCQGRKKMSDSEKVPKSKKSAKIEKTKYFYYWKVMVWFWFNFLFEWTFEFLRTSWQVYQMPNQDYFVFRQIVAFQ